MRTMINSISTTMFFFMQFLRSPGKTGSICPSSRFLSHTIANMALENNTSHGLIVDLGAGSGIISRTLLEYGVPPERILAVDISEYFKKVFNKHCPDLELYIGDARNLSKIISTYFPALPIQAIISSLPLRNMSNKIISEIMLEISSIIHKKGGILIQYTYALWMHSLLEQFGFIAIEKKYVFLNIPPAYVEKYYIKT